MRKQKRRIRFPWIGIWCKNGALVRHGVPAKTAWTHWSQSTGHLDLLQLQMHGSGLSRANLVPEAWIKVVARASLKPGCATHEEVLMRWRDWQLGSETSMDPMTFLRRPSREEALMNVHRKAQRALLDWQASDPAYCLPCSCRSCGQATRNICHYCLVGVCQECDNNTRHNSPNPCCAEMAGSDHVRFSALEWPFRPNSTELEAFEEVVLRDG